MFKILQTRSLSLFQLSWIKLECNVKNDKIEKNSNTDMYFFIEKRLKRAISYVYKRLGEEITNT